MIVEYAGLQFISLDSPSVSFDLSGSPVWVDQFFTTVLPASSFLFFSENFIRVFFSQKKARWDTCRGKVLFDAPKRLGQRHPDPAPVSA